MARQRFIIDNMPLRGGLMTAGQQGTIAENQLWQAKNITTGLDGLLTKRPGLWQWGQTLAYPVQTDDLSFYELFADLSQWDNSTLRDSIAVDSDNGKMRVGMQAASSGTETEIWGRTVEASQGDSGDADFSWRLTTRFINVQADSEFIVSAKARTGDSPYAFKVADDGIYYYATGGTWTLMYAYDFEDKGATSLEMRVDVSGSATLLLNDVSVATQLVSGMDTYSAFTVGTYIELFFVTDDTLTGQYTIYIFDLMMDGIVAYTDGDGVDQYPFDPQRLGAGTDFKTIVGSSAVERSLLVSSDKIVYRDTGLRREWSPLMGLTGGNVTFSPYGEDLMIFDADDSEGAKLYRWNGTDAPSLVKDAPPVRFGTEHRTRLLAAGDKRFPLRVYFTGSRKPEVWFAPESDADGQESFEETLDAGYLVMPGKRGDEVIALYGEYYGSCIVCTNRGIWRITGSSPQSYTVENVSQDSGCASQAGLERLGNDLWMAGRQGVTTIQTVQQFGDIKSQMPSAPIADLWTPGLANSSIKVDQYQMFRTSMAWNPTTGHMMFAFARQGASDVSSVMAFSTATGGWTGPWESDTTFVEAVEVASPVIQTVMHGTSIGKVAIEDPNWKMDFTSTITSTFESPYLSGRSLDPALSSHIKTWKVLRLFIQGLGDWKLQMKWQVDDETYVTSTESTNVFDLPRLGVDWRLDDDPDGRIHSSQLIGVLEIPLDIRGRYFKFELSTDDTYDGEDFILQGYQVEFTASGPDKEQQ